MHSRRGDPTLALACPHGWRRSAALVLAALACVFLGAASRAGAAPDGNTLVKVRLVLGQKALVPGETATLGLVLDIEPGWHIYWRNSGDGGAPTGFKLTAPPELVIGEAQWPAPERMVEPGGLVDFVYTKRVVLMFPVTLARGAKPGETIEIKAEADWMVCREVCVGGEGRAVLGAPVASDSGGTDHAALFEPFRARLPVELPARRDANVSARWDGRTLAIDAPGASKMVWYPYEYEDVTEGPTDLLAEGEAAAATLRVSYGSNIHRVKRIRGVAEVRRGGSSSFYLIELPPPTEP